MAKSFVLSKVTTDLLKNEEFGGPGPWRAMGTPDGEMQVPVRLDLFPITKTCDFQKQQREHLRG